MKGPFDLVGDSMIEEQSEPKRGCVPRDMTNFLEDVAKGKATGHGNSQTTLVKVSTRHDDSKKFQSVIKLKSRAVIPSKTFRQVLAS
jgi:hypothetical protein